MGIFQTVTDTLGITDYGGQSAQMGMAQAQFAGMEIPQLSPLELERLVSAGEITPEFAEIIKLQGNAYKDIYVDPRLKAQQMETLERMKELSKTGMTAEDRADLARIAQEEGVAERGSREAIIQQAQMRGVSGSGLEQAQKLISQQEGASRRSARDTEIAGIAAQRKIQALEQAGQLAGSIRSQEYGEQANIAQAQQMLEQFNVQNTQAQLAERARAQNAAREANLRARQDLMNQNVGLSNQEAMQRNQMAQQQFNNQMAIASGRAGQYQAGAQMIGQQNQVGMGGMSGLLGAGAIIAASDEDVKKDIKMNPEEIDALLEDLTGYSFRYKDEDIEKGIGTPGKKVGVMAQDIEDILPEAVMDLKGEEDNLKVLNNAEILPAVLASVGRLNDRLKKVEEK